MAVDWRDYGDMSLTDFKAELRRMNSPILADHDAESVYAAVQGYSRLFLAMAYHETKLGTLFTVPGFDASFKNPVALMLDSQYTEFITWAVAAREWRRRLIDEADTYKGGVYDRTTTLDDLIHTYAPASAGNDEARYVAVVEERLAAYGYKETPMAITYGRVPHPGYLDRLISKPEGQGWDNLGQRQPKFVVLHRMIGSLWGTDGYFRMAGVNALTDYGVGVSATDGADVAGTIIRWNDPRGVRAGWASGPVNGAYGDGLAIVNKYGINAVNRDGVSIEISGNYETPVDAKAFEEIAQLMAYWWDQMRIPHDKAPVNPATGISAIIWHQEFTKGTGKVCPGPVVMDATTKLIARAKAILKQHQEGTATATTTPKPPTPKPEPKYPEGLDAELAARWFGKVTAESQVFQFDPNGSVSRLWLAEGGKTGKYPALTSVETFGERVYYRFSNGSTAWRANAKTPPKWLTA